MGDVPDEATREAEDQAVIAIGEPGDVPRPDVLKLGRLSEHGQSGY
jgi:hypothetical protein